MTQNPTPGAEGMRLEPCPFCGGADIVSEGLNIFSVRCRSCGASTAPRERAVYAEGNWNNRAAAPVAPAGSDGEADTFDEELGFDPHGEREQLAMSWTLNLVGRALGAKEWAGGDGSETVDGDIYAEVQNIMTAAGLVNEDGDIITREDLAARAQPPAGEAVYDVLRRFRDLVAKDDPEVRSHHHPIWVEVAETLAHPANLVAPDGGERERVAYELVKQIGRLDHPGDEGYAYPDDDDAERDTLNGLIAQAREVMSLRPAGGEGAG